MPVRPDFDSKSDLAVAFFAALEGGLVLDRFAADSPATAHALAHYRSYIEIRFRSRDTPPARRKQRT